MSAYRAARKSRYLRCSGSAPCAGVHVVASLLEPGPSKSFGSPNTTPGARRRRNRSTMRTPKRPAEPVLQASAANNDSSAHRSSATRTERTSPAHVPRSRSTVGACDRNRRRIGSLHPASIASPSQPPSHAIASAGAVRESKSACNASRRPSIVLNVPSTFAR